VSMELQRHQLSIELQQWISDYLYPKHPQQHPQNTTNTASNTHQPSQPKRTQPTQHHIYSPTPPHTRGTDAFPLRGENRTGESVPHACRGNLKEGVLSINADSAPPADTNLQEGVSSLITAYCDYGVRFACAVGMGNLHAVQFHPEKSSETGLQILRNFLALVGAAACSL
jgi:hypothetical protein